MKIIKTVMNTYESYGKHEKVFKSFENSFELLRKVTNSYEQLRTVTKKYKIYENSYEQLRTLMNSYEKTYKTPIMDSLSVLCCFFRDLFMQAKSHRHSRHRHCATTL